MNSWQRFCKYYLELHDLEISFDISRMRFDEEFFSKMSPQVSKALLDMESLEKGAIANPDENRLVGHYWLRAPELSPDSNLTQEIIASIKQVKEFCSNIHSGKISGEKSKKFERVLLIGIGGSALGPQLVSDALGSSEDKLEITFVDNTDPDGIERVYQKVKGKLDTTLSVVVSKSGGTLETRNGMLELGARYKSEGLSFAKHAVAITCENSKLDQIAKEQKWLPAIYMWDWVGGRTSLFSPVGLVPAALQGIDIDSMLEGAKLMDVHTRSKEATKNPALLLSLMWHFAGSGKGLKDMVVLPYKDRLVLFSKYLQQLVMESLGKELDLDGNKVNQGIAVYGNKGSTDQHAYIQQLRDGLNNFFATFITVQEDITSSTSKLGATNFNNLQVEDGVTSGDYLSGFYQGTRSALYDNNRDSITISVKKLDGRSLGALIALFERAVSFYASFVNINAYHQPGVEAGKKAAGLVLTLQSKVQEVLKKDTCALKPEEIAAKINETSQVETIFLILEHLAANSAKIVKTSSGSPDQNTYLLTK